MMELFRVEIPKYIREVKLSDKQRPVYYEWNGMNIRAKSKQILQKYIKKGADPRTATPRHLREPYHFVNVYKGQIYDGYSDYSSKTKKPVHPNIYQLESKELLYDGEQFVLANSKQVGRPRYLQIKGQDIYSGNVREHTRGAIMEAIKNSFVPYLKGIQPVKEYPIRIAMELHDTIDNIYGNKNQRWDVDNRAYPYCKAFPDVLTDLGIIHDDDRTHITQPPVPLFCPIDKEEERKLVFIVEKDTRDIVANFHTDSYFLTGKKPIISFK